ncbi:N-formylglutamate deformylase [Roseobacter sp. YSTF-M11]|uniref:N-formylglutamate deformylase n=1 Tax=Roseobacter insulae TaxID=2859783 RepID=A0A9X1K2H8_9RHOB|nr:N-formylglutamate deformylase [Roseobacter insulae]MBW4707592.1 N-formylglutamate deformylase [Roseobacter insulae]
MPVDVTLGDSPLILAIPHAGTDLVDSLRNRLNGSGQALKDTDWHVDRLYRDLVADTTTVRARVHRYASDANRDPSGASLYPGQNTTGLIPMTDFDGKEIWNLPPTTREQSTWCAAFHTPYHAALAAQIARVRAQHGFAILYDCHSIRSEIPHLFDGTLPDLNIGTFMGASCDPQLADHVATLCRNTPGYSTVVNGRFKGGWTTRHYGRPATGVHALQMELAQSTYLTEEAEPWLYNPDKAAPLRALLRDILTYLQSWRPA